MNQEMNAEIVIVGRGLSGLCTALYAAQSGLNVTLIGKRSTFTQNNEHRASVGTDIRTTALMPSSVCFLRHLGIWSKVEPFACPLRSLSIVDITNRLFRTPTMNFDSHELGLSEFAWNVPNGILEQVLSQSIDMLAVQQLDMHVTSISRDGTHATCPILIDLEKGTSIRTSLIIACDGQHSMVREFAKIPVHFNEIGLSSMVYNIAHSKDHQNRSVEFHQTGGPFTCVPMKVTKTGEESHPYLSALIRTVPQRELDRLKAMTDEELASDTANCCHHFLGEMKVVGRRASFPLVIMHTDKLAAQGVALVGESAHAFPPIAAQGLNLSLRDGATLVEMLIDDQKQKPSAPLNYADVLERYSMRRLKDMNARKNMIELLSKSLLSGFLPGHLVRGAAAYAITSLPPLKRLVMRTAMEPQSDLPIVMQHARAS